MTARRDAAALVCVTAFARCAISSSPDAGTVIATSPRLGEEVVNIDEVSLFPRVRSFAGCLRFDQSRPGNKMQGTAMCPVSSYVPTYGLTHVALAVRDPQRSLQFYQAVLGVVAVYEDETFVQVQTPGTRDVIVFERRPRQAGKPGGVVHFGFRLRRAEDIDRARAAVTNAGGRIRETGEFVPGEPYLFFADPDGYEVEIWYELPTPVDPV
jgi:catechol 2,3-dioxygenase-like lactoylglutathione lyase family enzyme